MVELVEKIQSPRAMHWRGRGPVAVWRKKPRGNEH
jgi:hypothetical protein